MPGPETDIATLLAFLRAGEQSAAAAFTRIAGRLTRGEVALAEPPLTHLIADERRHDVALALHSAQLPSVSIGDSATRRFFRLLESREPCVHLARVAALDGCVCQVLSAALRPAARAALGLPLSQRLSDIRADEARHVRIARCLSIALGADFARLASIRSEVSWGFAALLAARAASFEAIGVDSQTLIRRIRHDG